MNIMVPIETEMRENKKQMPSFSFTHSLVEATLN